LELSSPKYSKFSDLLSFLASGTGFQAVFLLMSLSVRCKLQLISKLLDKDVLIERKRRERKIIGASTQTGKEFVDFSGYGQSS
jgi:hypothetical protein